MYDLVDQILEFKLTRPPDARVFVFGFKPTLDKFDQTLRFKCKQCSRITNISGYGFKYLINDEPADSIFCVGLYRKPEDIELQSMMLRGFCGHHILFVALDPLPDVTRESIECNIVNDGQKLIGP